MLSRSRQHYFWRECDGLAEAASNILTDEKRVLEVEKEDPGWTILCLLVGSPINFSYPLVADKWASTSNDTRNGRNELQQCERAKWRDDESGPHLGI